MGSKLTLVELPLPSLDLWPTTRDTVQTLNLTALVVQIVDRPPRESRHPEFRLVPRSLETLRYPRLACLLDQGKVDNLQLIVLVIDNRFSVVDRRRTRIALAEQALADQVSRLSRRASQTAEEIRASVLAHCRRRCAVFPLSMLVVARGSGRCITARSPILRAIPRRRIHHLPECSILTTRRGSARCVAVSLQMLVRVRWHRWCGVLERAAVIVVADRLGACEQAKRLGFWFPG